MPRQVFYGQIPTLIWLNDNVDSDEYGDACAAEDAIPGSLAVSADHQGVEREMERAGFVKMVSWVRPDTGYLDEDGNEQDTTTLTLWRKPGAPMPRKKITKLDTFPTGETIFACCGVEVVLPEDFEDVELAYVMACRREPKFEHHPAFRIFESPTLRCWLILPDTEYEVFDTRLI